ncbi:MAG: 16S rRNA (guanine(527)-N(7))-methyltransferase RsmG [Candidatus Sumerlaeia bacterium]|nr:16S rRNA (guanine(527)-N(7))-methyltransferase RsmG [Candidatus Sumerlaeia bacterium]
MSETAAASPLDVPADWTPERKFQEIMARALAEMNLHLSPMQAEQLRSLYEMLAEANETMNLVGEASPEAIALRHAADSLLLLTTGALDGMDVRYAIDVGSGAGFPGLPLAIAMPETTWLLVESTGKKSRFLEEAVRSLGLTNTSVSGTRSEALAHNAVKRESYDLAVFRAVSTCATICELGLPFLKTGGRLVAYKGPDIQTEVDEAAVAARTCGGVLRTVVSTRLPLLHHGRSIAVWDKVFSTPEEYPRREGIPHQRPLR